MFRFKKHSWRPVIAALAFVLGLMMIPTSTQQAQSNSNPGVLPPNTMPYGMSYGGWSVKWWQWLESIPAPVNPNFDLTGENCGQGQSGSVWFLGQSFAPGVITRTCKVPAGKALFFPIFNALFGSGAGDCEPTNPGVPCDVAALRAAAALWMDHPEVLEATIDGVPVQNLTGYRAKSLGPFSITYPENAIFGNAAGTYYPQVSDGYWLMLAPLSRGEHTIQIKVRAQLFPWDFIFDLNVTTKVVVGPQ